MGEWICVFMGMFVYLKYVFVNACAVQKIDDVHISVCVFAHGLVCHKMCDVGCLTYSVAACHGK